MGILGGSGMLRGSEAQRLRGSWGCSEAHGDAQRLMGMLRGSEAQRLRGSEAQDAGRLIFSHTLGGLQHIQYKSHKNKMIEKIIINSSEYFTPLHNRIGAMINTAIKRPG